MTKSPKRSAVKLVLHGQTFFLRHSDKLYRMGAFIKGLLSAQVVGNKSRKHAPNHQEPDLDQKRPDGAPALIHFAQSKCEDHSCETNR